MEQTNSYALLNGQIIKKDKATISPNDRGFIYGDGIYETIRIHHGKPFLWEWHMTRLIAGAETIKLKLPLTPLEILEKTKELIYLNGSKNCIARLTVTRGSSERGYDFTGDEISTSLICLYEMPATGKKNVSLSITNTRVAASDIFTKIKSNNKQVELNVLEAKKSKAAISNLNKDRASLAEELNFIRDNLAIASGESFIHRLAAKIYGVKNLADLSEEQIGSIALIFMCSVAGVISLAGPLLTFVAVSIQIQEEKKPSKSITRSIRFIFAALIKRLRKPKLITEIKEVEVEKEILKEVEVEKIIYQEVVKPEPVEIPVFVQVPVPTDPKDLPKMEELTKEKIKPISAIGGLN